MMKEVYNIIKGIRSISSTKEKENILSKNKNNENLKIYLKYVYDKSQYNYYFRRDLRKLTEFKEESRTNISFEQIKIIADILSSRLYTGNDAIAYISRIVEFSDDNSIELLQSLIDRDVKAGISVKTINKVWPSLINEMPYMRCSTLKKKSFSESDWEKGVYSQEKMDGEFANIEKYNGEYSILSRQCSEYEITSDFNNVLKEVEQINIINVNFTGEFIVFEDGSPLERGKSNGIMNSILKGGRLESNQEIHYYIWDYVPLEYFKPKGRFERGYSSRFNVLQDIKDFKYVHLVDTRIIHSFNEAQEHFKYIVNVKKGEGLVLKKSDAIWRDGTSTEVFKWKPEAQCELRIVDVNWEGKGKNKDLFKSLICRSEDQLLEVAVSGFKDDKRKEIFNNIDQYMDKVISVKFNGITKAENKDICSLTHPRFDGEVFHKTTPNNLSEIQDIFQSVLELGGM